MVLRSDQQQGQGQTQRCEMGEGMASLWNELLPRLKQLNAADEQGDTNSRTTDSRLGQGKQPPFHAISTDSTLQGLLFMVISTSRNLLRFKDSEIPS